LGGPGKLDGSVSVRALLEDYVWRNDAIKSFAQIAAKAEIITVQKKCKKSCHKFKAQIPKKFNVIVFSLIEENIIFLERIGAEPEALPINFLLLEYPIPRKV
jgi:hypothetical protein